MLRWAPLVVVLVAVTALSLSSSVGHWWTVQSTPGSSRLPGAVDEVLQARSNSSDADVHVVLWFVAVVALVWAMRSAGWSRLLIVAVALWLYSGVLELGQRWVPARSSQWIDLVGNAVGIFVGLTVGCCGLAVFRRFGRSRPAESIPTPTSQ